MANTGVVMLLREFHPLIGGYQSQALRLADELIRQGVPVQVLTQRHGHLASHEDYRGIPIHRVGALGHGHVAAWSYLGVALLWMVRSRRTFSVIHAHRSSSGLIGGLVGRVLGKGVLCKLTRGDEIDVKGYRRTLVGRLKLRVLRATVDRFVAITNDIGRDLRTLRIPSDQIVQIDNGVELKDRVGGHDRLAIKADLGWSPEARVVTYVGRLVRAKGIDWLLEVWRVLETEGKEWRLLVVGDGPERAALEQQARAAGMLGTVVFVGRQEDVFRFLAVTDVFVLPSRMEGAANALLEAMSQGIPVVVADDELAGNREIVRHELDGYVVPFGDSAGLARVLRRLLADSELRDSMGRRARRRVEERFSISSVATRYRAVYETLAARAGSG